MLSYQHVFHAGNHADILKHFVLVNVIKYMNQKEKPYTLFDTHAGSGIYMLNDERALKTGENKTGILKLIDADKSGFFSSVENESSVKDFISYLENYISKGEYPGSPFIESDFMRGCDKLVISELHPKEIESLKENIKFHQREIANETGIEKNINIHKRNGFEMLSSLTPPDTKRGCVLIDPSYEEISDYDEVEDAVIRVFKKWSGGVFMIWYPLLSYRIGKIEAMVEKITEGVKLISPNTDVNDFRLCVSCENEHIETSFENIDSTQKPRLYGSGMLVINPPWTLKSQMDKIIPLFEACLKNWKIKTEFKNGI